jgi:cobalt-zinc-cadmium efflux system outer membrane protein
MKALNDMSFKLRAWLLGLLCLVGCHADPNVRQNVDALICERTQKAHDPQPLAISTQSMLGKSDRSPMPHATIVFPADLAPASKAADPVQLTSFQTPKDQPVPKTTLDKRLQEKTAPQTGLPGGEAPAIVVPSIEGKKKEEIEKIMGGIAKKYFPPVASVGPDPGPVPGRPPLTLAELQQLALTNSPLIRQAASDVEAARGSAVQAGAYPNPTFGVQSATAGPSGGPNYGISFGQTIKTMGKLKLAQAAALMDLENARLAYRRAETDLMTAVRGGYFAVLVAQESIKANRALVLLTDEVYKVMVDQMKSGEFATYEPMQVAVFDAQARAALITARNGYTLAWKQLAATLGLPALPPSEVVGRIDMPAPVYQYDKLLAHVLTRHTEVLTAAAGVEKARFNLRLAEVTAVPDVTLASTLLQDNLNGANNRLTFDFSLTVPVPVWDLNKGAIFQARAALLRANEEPHRVRDDLTSRLADAFRRYSENRDILEMYRTEILPKQIQAFRAAVKRHYVEGPVSVAYTDLISAEQNLVSVIGPYVTTVGAFWQAVTDVANLLQTDDLFQLADGQACPAPIPDLEQLLQLPCCHPCSHAQDPALRGANGNFPPAGFRNVPVVPEELPIPGNKMHAPMEIGS